jgi:hypothetical protein
MCREGRHRHGLGLVLAISWAVGWRQTVPRTGEHPRLTHPFRSQLTALDHGTGTGRCMGPGRSACLEDSNAAVTSGSIKK